MNRLFTLGLLFVFAAPAVAQDKADPGATKLLADARAARATWDNFPGFEADLEINDNGKLTKARALVDNKGKVTLDMPEGDLKSWTRRELASLVGHRLPGSALDTPRAFADDITTHPLGRTIKVLNDELHSSYRIRDRQILEVNRVTGDVRFTINVLDTKLTPEKKYLPVSHVVNHWDTKAGTLKRSTTFHHTWSRQGTFDLPATVLVIDATPGPLEIRKITFSNVKVK